jgi:hypothetical protein
MSKIFFGKTKTEVLKEKKAETVVEQLEQKKEELAASIDEMLAKTGPFNPTHKAYSLLLKGKNWHIVEVDIDLSTLQSKATVLESGYESETRAIGEMNKKLASQSMKILKGVK